MTAEEMRRLGWVLTQPHVRCGDICLRIIILMHGGVWVLCTMSNKSPEMLVRFGLLEHPITQAAIRWCDEANARLARERAAGVITKVMQL